VHVVVHVLSGAVPLFDTTHHYQYGFVFDADGDPSNNYEADASYPDDFFAGTDRWYEAAYTPSAGWSLKATDATTFAPVQTSARIALVNDTVTLLVPASEMTAESPRYRVTAFEHKGDYGIAEPHDWKGDVEPPVAEGLSSF
jgi:hypothetical protein